MNDSISRQDAIRIASGYCHPANIADELRKLPPAQPDVPDTNVGDMISRQTAIDALWKERQQLDDYMDECLKKGLMALRAGTKAERNRIEEDIEIIKKLPPAQSELHWNPFKTRPLTEEEKEDHPEWDCILDCKLPDDGQRILVSINLRGHEAVQQDEFYSDDGSYLDSGYEIGTEAIAWMPLPEPYQGEGEEHV